MSKPRTAAEIWEELVLEAGEDEIEAACRMTDEEVEAYLAANGFDVAEEKRKAEAFLTALGGRAPAREASPVVQASDPVSERDQRLGRDTRRTRPPERRKLGSSAGWVATVATAALGVTAATSVVLATPNGHGDIQPDRPAPPQVSPAAAEARELRERARGKLDEWLPADCLELLDEAATKDPQGDQSPEVVEMRNTATERLQVGPKSPKSK